MKRAERPAKSKNVSLVVLIGNKESLSLNIIPENMRFSPVELWTTLLSCEKNKLGHETCK
jgi:hypothetical protein